MLDRIDSLVFTIPVPKQRSQKRFTATRAVRGFSRETSHFARSSRSGARPANFGWGR